MGGGRDFATGKLIYIRRNGIYERRDENPVNHRNKDKDVPATLKNFDGNVNTGKDYYDRLLDIEKRTIQEGLDFIQAYIDKSDFRIRVSNRAMTGILNTGEIQNQMQVGTSNGMYDPDERKEISMRLFDHDGNLEDYEYEKYGYLSDGQADVADWYGDFDIVLKKNNVINRTTMTLGDSLDYDIRYPSFVTNPQWVSGGRYYLEDALDFRNKAERLYQTGRFEDNYDGYAELQFHGRLTLADIDHISMPKSWKYNPPSDQQDVIAKIKNAGIKITYDAHD